MNETELTFLQNTLTFWEHIDITEQEHLLSHILLERYAQGEAVYGAEKDCLGVLVVKSGELRAFMLSEDGREITLYRLREGDVCIMSASCLLKNITFEMRIEAAVESETYLIDLIPFAQLQENNVYVENFSLNVAVGKFSEVMRVMEQILFMRFDKRLATFLLEEAAKKKSKNIKLTQEQIAKYMGSAREVVSRMMKRFEKEGIVQLYHGGVQIIDKNKLRDLL